MAASTADIGEAVAQLFVRVSFPPQAKARVEGLVDHLLGAMGRAIRGNSWMTDTTRTEALTKLAAFGYKIGYPNEWRDYSGLAVDRTSFLANRLAASAFEMRRQLGRLGRPVDPGEWLMPAHVVNAYYHPLRNEIVFPAGILQQPFFYADADEAVNYGGIGTVIGHEITHGFDDTGSRFDAAGALRDWWTIEDRIEFERRADVLVQQFNGFVIAEGVTVNGKLTLGENIADLGWHRHRPGCAA